MATYESTQTSAITGSASSVVLTKPTGLAVGDYMIAHLCSINSGADAFTFSAPAGWTLLVNEHANGTTATLRNRMQIFAKVAESADVAASNFTFSLSSGSGSLGGALSRITNYGKLSGNSSTVRINSSTTGVSFSGFTPDRASCLLLMFVQGGEISGTDPTFSNYAIATSNPAWTERYEFSDAGAFAIGMAMATATRPEKTATGDASFDATSLPANSDVAMALIALGPVLNVTSTPTPLTSNAAILNVLHVRSATAGIVQPRTKQETVWTDETKATTTWTDEIK